MLSFRRVSYHFQFFTEMNFPKSYFYFAFVECAKRKFLVLYHKKLEIDVTFNEPYRDWLFRLISYFRIYKVQVLANTDLLLKTEVRYVTERISRQFELIWSIY